MGTSSLYHEIIKPNTMKNLKFLLLGFCFGFILIKAEVISWFRIQEMFRFQSFHMYGVMCSAMAVGIISILIIKKYKIKTIDGEEIKIAPKEFSKGNIYGGLLFGLGWAMTGACPGPIFALLGSGVLVFAIVFLSAVLGTYTYGVIKDKLPH
jgi:uncharacterized membrane protein YedE/YeeE